MKFMEEITVKKQKELLVDLLVYIDNICKKNNINYSLIGGSLIGSIRHKGIIPWDDDIDIILLDDEYEKLINILKQENGRYKLLDHRYNSSYYYPFAKIIDTKTTIKEDGYKEIEEYGVYLDIFKYFKVSNSKVLRKIQYKLLMFQKNVLRFYYCNKHNNKNAFIKNLAVKILNKIGHKPILFIYNKICDIHKNDKKSKYISPNWPTFGEEKSVQKLSDFQKFINTDFEGHKIMITKNYDRILKTTFGNYMKFPPKNEQVSLHHFKAYWK